MARSYSAHFADTPVERFCQASIQPGGALTYWQKFYVNPSGVAFPDDQVHLTGSWTAGAHGETTNTSGAAFDTFAFGVTRPIAYGIRIYGSTGASAPAAVDVTVLENNTAPPVFHNATFSMVGSAADEVLLYSADFKRPCTNPALYLSPGASGGTFHRVEFLNQRTARPKTERMSHSSIAPTSTVTPHAIADRQAHSPLTGMAAVAAIGVAERMSASMLGSPSVTAGVIHIDRITHSAISASAALAPNVSAERLAAGILATSAAVDAHLVKLVSLHAPVSGVASLAPLLGLVRQLIALIEAEGFLNDGSPVGVRSAVLPTTVTRVTA